MSRELLQQALGALGTSTWDHTRAVGKQELITALRAALAQPEPAPAVPNDAALNTLAKMFHSGEEIEGDNGAAMMVDMALWHEASEAFDSLIGDGDGSADGLGGAGGGEKDPMYDQAVEIVLKNRKASISLVQRHLKIGYNRAARLVEDMEKAGLVSAMSTSGQRDILVPARAAE